jgi:hypothetical protein
MEINGRKVTGKLVKNCKYKFWISAIDIYLIISYLEPIIKILFACNCENSAANGSSEFVVIQPLRLHSSSPFSLKFPQFRLKIIFKTGS